MKYTLTLLILTTVLLINKIEAQNLITLQSGGVATFYTSFSDAYSASANGDTIYLPGGSFSAPEISKELTIYGVGYDIDSTQATGFTYIPSTLIVNASYCKISGIKVNAISIGTGNNNVTIERCLVDGTLDLGYSTYNCIVKNCIVRQLEGRNSITQYISNNIIWNYLYEVDYSTITNNILAYGATNMFDGNDYCEITNNFFLNDTYGPNVGSSFTVTYSNFFNNSTVSPNNLCASSGTGYGNTNICADNLYNVIDESEFFVSYLETYSMLEYAEMDFHLAPDSPFANAGTDGTDIGIYGGPFPWKDGGLPPIPHVYYKDVDLTTNPNGELEVIIGVRVED